MKTMNETYIINIGAQRSGAEDIAPGELWNAFRVAGLCPVNVDGPRWMEHAKGGEPTYAAQLDERPTNAQLLTLCDKLGQECIAIACLPMTASNDHNGAIALWGELVGPMAEEWGPFNHSMFMLPGGLPLMSVMASA